MATSILIIDEVSMLSANTLEMAERICREVRGNSLPFGGLQVVLVGDFFQLPPISPASRKARFAYESPLWPSLNLRVCYLTEQHRQEDRRFLSILSAIRRNAIDESHQESLMERKIEMADAPRNATRLFSHNVDVDRINLQELEKISKDAYKFNMRGSGAKALVEQLKRGCLSPEVLELKKGAVVMFTKNSPQGAYVNGTMGKVVGFAEVTNYPIVETAGKTRIAAEPVKWAIEDGMSVLATIEQVPLRLAWAITVHKSQGMSMDSAVMDLSKSFEYGQGYVALSRVRSLSGLHLIGINDRAVMVDSKILEQDQIFQSISEATAESLASLSPGELELLQVEFIKSCEGSVKEVAEAERDDAAMGVSQRKSEKKWAQTLRLLQDGLSLEEIADQCNIRVGTVFQHLEELQDLGKLPVQDVLRMAEGNYDAIMEIKDAFSRLGDEKMKPVFEDLEERFTYDDIRLARLIYRQEKYKG